ncbi:MAG: EamA family transporter [Proteobacteria bacterium]|nr:EamA family transporter [Pseudomonadota bacterium]
MSLDPFLIAIVLLAAVTHASWNAIVKWSGDRFILATVIQGIGAGLAGVAAFFVPFPAAAAWPFIIVSAILHTGYHLALINAYKVGDLSLVYPLARGTAPLIVAIGAAMWVGEVPTTMGAVGIVMVSVGIMLLGFEKGLRRRETLLPFGLAIAVGLFIASYSVVDGIGIRKDVSRWSYILWLFILEGVPFLFWTALFRRHQVIPFVRSRWRQALAASILAKIAYGCVLYAFVTGALASVTALRETSVLFAALIGSVFLGEKLGLPRIAAAIVIVAGVTTIQLSG